MTYRKLNTLALAAATLGTACILTACAGAADTEVPEATDSAVVTEEYTTEAETIGFTVPDGAVLTPDDFLKFLGEEIEQSTDGGLLPEKIADYLEAYGEEYPAHRFRERTEGEERLYYEEPYSFSGECGDDIQYQLVTLGYDESYSFLFTDKTGEWRLSDILFSGRLEDSAEPAITEVTLPGTEDTFFKIRSNINSGTGNYTSEESWYHIGAGKTVLVYMCEDMDSNFEEYMYDMVSDLDMVKIDGAGTGISLTLDYAFYDGEEEDEETEEVLPIFKKDVVLTFLWDARAKAFLLKNNENHFPWYQTANIEGCMGAHTYASDVISMFYEDLEALAKDGSKREKTWVKNLKDAAALGY